MATTREDPANQDEPDIEPSETKTVGGLHYAQYRSELVHRCADAPEGTKDGDYRKNRRQLKHLLIVQSKAPGIRDFQHYLESHGWKLSCAGIDEVRKRLAIRLNKRLEEVDRLTLVEALEVLTRPGGDMPAAMVNVPPSKWVTLPRPSPDAPAVVIGTQASDGATVWTGGEWIRKSLTPERFKILGVLLQSFTTPGRRANLDTLRNTTVSKPADVLQNMRRDPDWCRVLTPPNPQKGGRGGGYGILSAGEIRD
jgi:hypothetical protein